MIVEFDCRFEIKDFRLTDRGVRTIKPKILKLTFAIETRTSHKHQNTVNGPEKFGSLVVAELPVRSVNTLI